MVPSADRDARSERIIMKKTVSLIICTVMLLSMMLVFAAAEANPTVYVNISDGSSEIALAYKSVSVTDTDGDGAFTISDALYCAHEAYFEGGAAAGYVVENTQYGISLVKLWGVESGGSFGYCLNNASAMSLADEVKDGDVVSAYAYADTAGFSDVFAYFSENECGIDENADVSLKLFYISYDENFSPVTSPVADAEIYYNGESTGVKTAEDGSFTVNVGAMDGIVTARSSSLTLVPPVCKVHADTENIDEFFDDLEKQNSGETKGGGSTAATVAIVAVIVIAVAATVAVIYKKKKGQE